MKAQVASGTAGIGRAVAYDYESCIALGDWRRDLAWPVAPAVLEAVFRDVLRAFVGVVHHLDGDAQRIAIAVVGPAASVAQAAGEAALCVEAEGTRGLRVTSIEPEFEYLRSGTGSLPPRLATFGAFVAPRLPIRNTLTMSRRWTPLRRLPATLFAPDAVAISENSLLAAEARRSERTVQFRHSGVFMKQLRAAASRAPDASAPQRVATEALTEALAAAIPVQDMAVAERLKRVLRETIESAATAAARDLAACASLRHMPGELWSGTSGSYPSRIVGLEVQRRGGTVVRFEHGGTLGMTAYPEWGAVSEFNCTTRYVMASQALAENIHDSGALAMVPSEIRAEVVGGGGDPMFRREWTRSPPDGLRRVMYCPSFLYGFRRDAWFTIPDSVSLDWSLRLTEALAALPIQLLCKPHPDGVLGRKPHPVAQIATTSYGRFEDHVPHTDLFVFDRAYSTAFWEALCTDRPVIFIEQTPPPLHPRIDRMVRERCIVLTSRFDDRNRPVLDPRELADAVRSAPAQSDPGPFRRLLGGTSA